MTPSAQDNQTQKKQNGQTSQRFGNTERDEATLGNSHEITPSRPGLADGDQPGWAPPESQPEPRPVDPVLNPPAQNTNSPA